MKIQPVEFCHANKIPFIEGCVIKYICRWRDKGRISDLAKAKHFIEILIDLEKENYTKETDIERDYELLFGGKRDPIITSF